MELSPKEAANMEDYHSVVKQKSLPSDFEIERAKKLIEKIFLYYSDNDYHSTQQMFLNFLEKLDAVPVFCKGYGHFTKRHNITELPNIKALLEKLKI